MKDKNEVSNAIEDNEENTLGKKQSKYQRGDTVVWEGSEHNVVEVIESNRWHIKNKESPFNSLIITASDLEESKEKKSLEAAYDESVDKCSAERLSKSIADNNSSYFGQKVSDPDLKVRENNKYSL